MASQQHHGDNPSLRSWVGRSQSAQAGSFGVAGLKRSMGDKEVRQHTNQPDMSPVLDSASLGPHGSARIDALPPHMLTPEQQACLVRSFPMMPDYAFFPSTLPNQASDATQLTSLPGALSTLPSKGSSNSSSSITPEMQNQLSNMWNTFAQIAQANNPAADHQTRQGPSTTPEPEAGSGSQGQGPSNQLPPTLLLPPREHYHRPSAEHPSVEAAAMLKQHDARPGPAGPSWQHKPPFDSNLLTASGSCASDLSHAPSKEQQLKSFGPYEKKYGLALKCETGVCAVEVGMPCSTHKCTCCKMGRQVSQYSRQGWCGPCGRREVVSGLKFVRCGRCKAEMLEDTYTAHLKQNVSILDADGKKTTGRCIGSPHEVVSTDKGRRCGKCTNMRPLTFYNNTDSNCTCNMHLPSKLTTRHAPEVKQQQGDRVSRPPPGRQVVHSHSHPGLAHIDTGVYQAGEAGPSQLRHPQPSVAATQTHRSVAVFRTQAVDLQSSLQASLALIKPASNSLSSMILACQQLSALAGGQAESGHTSHQTLDTTHHSASLDTARGRLESNVEELRGFLGLLTRAVTASDVLLSNLAAADADVGRPRSPGVTSGGEQSAGRSHSATTVTEDIAEVAMHHKGGTSRDAGGVQGRGHGQRTTSQTTPTATSLYQPAREGSLGPFAVPYAVPVEGRQLHGSSDGGAAAASHHTGGAYEYAGPSCHPAQLQSAAVAADTSAGGMQQRQSQPHLQQQVKVEHSGLDTAAALPQALMPGGSAVGMGMPGAALPGGDAGQHVLMAGMPALAWLSPYQAMHMLAQQHQQQAQQGSGAAGGGRSSPTPAPESMHDGDAEVAGPAAAALLALKSGVERGHSLQPAPSRHVRTASSGGGGADSGGDAGMRLVRPTVHRLTQPSSQLQAALNIPTTPGAAAVRADDHTAGGGSQSLVGDAQGAGGGLVSATAGGGASGPSEVVVLGDQLPAATGASLPRVGGTAPARQQQAGMMDAAALWSAMMQHGGQMMAIPGWQHPMMQGLMAAAAAQGQQPHPLLSPMQLAMMSFPAAAAAAAGGHQGPGGKRDREGVDEEQGSEQKRHKE